MSKKISGSLSTQLLCGVFAAMLAALMAFSIILGLGNMLLDRTVYGQTFAHKMADKQCSELQEYVAAEQITAENIQRLKVWCRQERKIDLSIYDSNDCILFASSHSEEVANTNGWVIEDEEPESQYMLRLSDGTTVTAFVYYYAGDAFYFGITALAALAAFFAFSLCFIALVHHKLTYVKKLKEELDILSGGALEYPVTVHGRDELGQLAYGIDQMRQSILAHQHIEELTRAASLQLVTAMSHDLRTPLTSLLAYLELIDRGKYENPEQLHLFIKKSLDKTYRIKTMADQLFEYFLVYSAEWEQPDLEKQNADTLFRQIWSDYAFSLESKGFSVNTDFQPIDGIVQVNVELLRRTFDNLYSNLLKYADPGKPVEIAFVCRNKEIQLRVANHISPFRDKRESTNIGLNTCVRVMEYHNGTFTSTEENDIFTATLTFPLSKTAL